MTKSLFMPMLLLGVYLCSAAVAPAQQLTPSSIRDLTIELTKDGRIDEDEAKEIALEAWKSLWERQTKAKVRSCDEVFNKTAWKVLVWNDNGLEGEGCEVVILKAGPLLSAKFVPGG